MLRSLNKRLFETRKFTAEVPTVDCWFEGRLLKNFKEARKTLWSLRETFFLFCLCVHRELRGQHCFPCFIWLLSQGCACVAQETFHGRRAVAQRRAMKEPSGHIRPGSICHSHSGLGGRGCTVITTCSHGELLIERSEQRLCQRLALMISAISLDCIGRRAFECSQACLCERCETFPSSVERLSEIVLFLLFGPAPRLIRFIRLGIIKAALHSRSCLYGDDKASASRSQSNRGVLEQTRVKS